ncbi:MAG: DoxX family protein [Bdellovibrionaceae bacterium]|nr:DoxX family protein [Pseudobdellovibrionaceae bacterium]
MYYGTSCLTSQRMVIEFNRYKMSSFRVAIGVLQISASFGLVAGFFLPWLTLLSSLGLAIQMFLGVIVRFKIKDSFVEAIPAFIFCILNLFIFYATLMSINRMYWGFDG